MDEIINNLKDNLQEAYKDTIILTVTEFGRTIKQNGGNGTDMVMELQYLWQGVC